MVLKFKPFIDDVKISEIIDAVNIDESVIDLQDIFC